MFPGILFEKEVVQNFMETLVNVILPVFVVAGVAALVQPWLKLDVGTLSRVAARVFLPALTFDALWRSAPSIEDCSRMAAAAVLVTLVLLAFSEVLARVLRLNHRTRGAFAATIMLANAGIYGLPVITSAFGDAAVMPASVYIVVFNAVLLNLAGIYLAILGQKSLKGVLHRVVGNPVIYAAILGLAAREDVFTVPLPLLKAITWLGAGALPVFLIVLGLQMRESVTGSWEVRHLPALAGVVSARLVLAPLLALGFAELLGLQGLFRAAFVVDNAMPSAVLATVLTAEFESDSAFAALGVLATTIASLLSVTLWVNWLS